MGARLDEVLREPADPMRVRRVWIGISSAPLSLQDNDVYRKAWANVRQRWNSKYHDERMTSICVVLALRRDQDAAIAMETALYEIAERRAITSPLLLLLLNRARAGQGAPLAHDVRRVGRRAAAAACEPAARVRRQARFPARRRS